MPAARCLLGHRTVTNKPSLCVLLCTLRTHAFSRAHTRMRARATNLCHITSWPYSCFRMVLTNIHFEAIAFKLMAIS